MNPIASLELNFLFGDTFPPIGSGRLFALPEETPPDAEPEDEILVGGRGDDTLTSGDGSDLLVGGDGADTFIVGRSSDRGLDTIADLEPGDRILIADTDTSSERIIDLNLSIVEGITELTATLAPADSDLSARSVELELVGEFIRSDLLVEDNAIAAIATDTSSEVSTQVVTFPGFSTASVHAGSSNRDTIVPSESAPGLFFTGAKNDWVDLRNTDTPGHRIYGGPEDDVLYANQGDRLMGGAGSDYLDASDGSGDNYLLGGSGDDVLVAGSGDRLNGGSGDDSLVVTGSGNRLSGGTGADQFWIANGDLPNPPSEILDFTAGEDIIGLADTQLSFESLEFLQQDNNLHVLAGDRELAILRDVDLDALTSSDVVFAENEEPADDIEEFTRFSSDAELEAYLLDIASEQYADFFGETTIYFGNDPFATLRTGNVEELSFDLNGDIASVSGSLAAFEDATNVQVEGVDEAGLAETDGEFIYQASSQLLTVVDVRNPQELSIASQFDLAEALGAESYIQGIYLQGDRLTVISESSPYRTFGGSSRIGLFADGVYWRGDRQHVNVTVLDVSDPAEISVLETTQLDGNLVDSRAVGDRVRVVTQNSLVLPAPETFPVEEDPDPSPLPEFADYWQPWWAEGIYETEAEYRDRWDEGAMLAEVLPEYTTEDGEGNVLGEGFLSDATQIYQPLSDEIPYELTAVSSFNVGDDLAGIDTSTSIPNSGTSDIYMTPAALYLLTENWREGQTEIVKFDLASQAIAAAGSVPGRIVDRFAIDESDGYLRIATTVDYWEDAQNNLYVLDANSEDLEVVGEVEGFAPGEILYSVRFEGDRGFAVTFRQIDPFFSFDLSDPSAPEIAGELKLPGFSNYLQVIEEEDKTLVLGIGRDADPITGWAEEVKVTLFDVTDLAEPVEIDSVLFEGEYSNSEALWNHHAVSYFPESGLLAIPFQTYQEDEITEGLRVFQVDSQTGLTPLGDIESEGGIRRSLQLDSELYAVSDGQISARELPSLDLLSEVVWEAFDWGYRVAEGDFTIA